MTSMVAKVSLGMSRVMRRMGAALDNVGKSMEVTKYTERLVPSTRFVAVDGVSPQVSEMSFVAHSASVVGDVTIGKESSVWYGAIVRGDVSTVTIGAQSSIGDRAVVHVAKIQGDLPTTIGDRVVVGAGAVIHAATLQDRVLIGEGAQVLDGCIVERHSIVSPASVVPPGTVVPSGELWSGNPAKKVRELTADEMEDIARKASETVVLASQHAVENGKDYKTILEEEEVLDIREALEDTSLPPLEPVRDPSDVQGQGHPGRIFRSTLTHPEEGFKYQQEQQQQKKKEQEEGKAKAA